VYKHLNPQTIRYEVEQSLKRLKTDRIDLYQTHWQDPTTPIGDTMAELEKLRDEGKIRAIGVSNATPEQMNAYLAAGRIDSDQEKYSMLDREREADNLPYCRNHDLAFLAYSPLAQGLLTGKVGPERTFDEGDQRNKNPRFSRENRERIQAMLAEFAPIAAELTLTLGQLAIAWTLAQPGCSHVLVGARNPTQVLENAGAGTRPLPADAAARISDILEKHTGTLS
jgi:aryl-alcohol dehydrogenase-like predicted oxidoreductase